MSALNRFICATIIVLCAACVRATLAQGLPFSEVVIDTAGPRAPWAKGVADIDQDGLTDILIGGHQPRTRSLGERIASKTGLSDDPAEIGELVWYEAPHWHRHVISTAFAVRTDVEAGDLDEDGDLDVIALTDSGVVWFEAPDWQPHVIDTRKFHDLELVQLNPQEDRRPDLVLRNQSLFGYDNGNAVEVMLSAPNNGWTSVRLPAPHGEGLQVIAGDQPVVIVNDVMFTAPNAAALADPAAWRTTRFTTLDWSWPDVTIAAADFNGDGRLDVALAPAEEKDSTYRLSWFEAPAVPGGDWREHVVIEQTEAVHHSLVAADFDGDGQVDLATAQMNQGADPDEVVLLRNLGQGEKFAPQVLASEGSHNLHVVDADGDFDPDLVGTNWERDSFDGDYRVTLWRNEKPDELWPRYVIDSARPNTAINVFPIDMDDDDRLDMVTGGFWYRNPGSLAGNWSRSQLGNGIGNAIVVAQLDPGEVPDVISTTWAGDAKPSLKERILGKLGLGPDAWRRSYNHLEVHFNPATDAATTSVVAEDLSGDWPHGAALYMDEGRRLLTLSMHFANTPLVTLEVPSEPTARWPVINESPSSHSQNEAVTAVDVNGDGREDFVTGTRWVDGRSGQLNLIAQTRVGPDRHVVIPATDAQPLRVAAGDETSSKVGRVMLYAFDNGVWSEELVGTASGPMSIDAGDIDLDGDIDIVIGEHILDEPELSRVIWFERRDADWIPHRVGVGDEHHDGTQLADFDGDGDLDIASIGGLHPRVLLYENPLRSP